MKTISLFILIILAFGSGIAQDTLFKNIPCDEAVVLIEQNSSNTDFVIIDFRTEQMFNEGHIENAVYHDVFADDVEDFLDNLCRSKTYFIYCNGGHRSGIAMNKMKEMGFKKIYHLYEGIIKWKEKGLPIIVSTEP